VRVALALVHEMATGIVPMLGAMEAMKGALVLRMEAELMVMAPAMGMRNAPIHLIMEIIHVVPALATAMRNAPPLLVMANMAPRSITTVITVVVLDRAMANMPKPGRVTMVAGRKMAPVTEVVTLVIVAGNQVRVKISQDVAQVALNTRRWPIAAVLAVLAVLSVPSFGMISAVAMAHRIIAVDRC
jgi:hypothetical protein